MRRLEPASGVGETLVVCALSAKPCFLGILNSLQLNCLSVRSIRVLCRGCIRQNDHAGLACPGADQAELGALVALGKQTLARAQHDRMDCFCQREICQAIEDGKGDYLFVVKDNQPELKASIAESFGALSPRGPGRSTARFEDRRNG
jgi:hypothetical protein